MLFVEATRRSRSGSTPRSNACPKVGQFGSNLAFNSFAMKPSILIVDDEPQMREVLSLFLTEHRHQVFTASISTETLEFLEQEGVNLVVLDIGLGGEDGLKLLCDIKAEHPDTQVVMLTGMGF